MLIYGNTTDYLTTYYVWLEIRSPRVGSLDWVIMLCSWTRHFTFTVPLPTQEYRDPHTWVLVKLVNCLAYLAKSSKVTCGGLIRREGSKFPKRRSA